MTTSTHADEVKHTNESQPVKQETRQFTDEQRRELLMSMSAEQYAELARHLSQVSSEFHNPANISREEGLMLDWYRRLDSDEVSLVIDMVNRNKSPLGNLPAKEPSKEVVARIQEIDDLLTNPLLSSAEIDRLTDLRIELNKVDKLPTEEGSGYMLHKSDVQVLATNASFGADLLGLSRSHTLELETYHFRVAIAVVGKLIAMNEIQVSFEDEWHTRFESMVLEVASTLNESLQW
jgi:hypothetical protein